MTKASDKYRNWFESDLLVADLMDQAADDIDERDAEIERLQLALGAMLSAYDHEWEVGDAIVRCRKIMADGQKPWEEIETLKNKVKHLYDELRMIEIIACHIGSTKEAIIHSVRVAIQQRDTK